MTDVVVITESNTNVVEVIQPPAVADAVSAPPPQIVEVVAIGPQGPQGPQGPAGLDTIAGYPTTGVSSPIDGDVLGFNGSAWYNRKQETLSDGGNF